jgi:uncharacterized membrane protein YbhN (UPF0104 family)
MAPSAPQPGPGRRKTAWNLLRLLLGVGLLAWLIASGRLNLSALARVRPDVGFFLLAAATLIGLAATSFRWLFLIQAAARQPDVAGLLRTALGSNVFATVSPAATGADIARVYYLVRRCGMAMLGALGLSLVDRLMGVQALLLCAAAAGWLSPVRSRSLAGTRLALVAAAVVATLILLGCLLPACRRLALRCLPASWRARLAAAGDHWDPAWLGGAYLCSLVAAVSNLSLPVLGLLALQPGIPWANRAFPSALIVLVNAVAPTPGGLGAGEAAASELFRDRAVGAAAMLLARVAGTVCAAVMGLLLLVRTPHVEDSAGQEPDGSGAR